MSEEQPEPAYFEVRLSRSVTIGDHLYKANLNGGERHVVDQATLDAMGDAVASSIPASVT